MNNAEFMQLIAGLRDLDHHQRKCLSESFSQVGDEAKVFDLIESCFEAKKCLPALRQCRHPPLWLCWRAAALLLPAVPQDLQCLTGTPLARLRGKPKWLDYLAALKQSLTVRQAAADTGIHHNTSFRWRHRFLSWISEDRPPGLGGITEADETYPLESGKGKRDLGRAPRKRGGSATKPGISDEQVCLLVARDRAGQRLLDQVPADRPQTETRARCPAGLRYQPDLHGVLRYRRLQP